MGIPLRKVLVLYGQTGTSRFQPSCRKWPGQYPSSFGLQHHTALSELHSFYSVTPTPSYPLRRHVRRRKQLEDCGKTRDCQKEGRFGSLGFCAFSPERWGALPKSPFLLSSLSLTAVSTNGAAGFLPSETESNKQPLIKQILTATSPAYTSSTIRRSHRRSRWWPPRGPSPPPR